MTPVPGASLSNGLLASLPVLLTHRHSLGAAGAAAGLQEAMGMRACYQQWQGRHSAGKCMLTGLTVQQ